MTIADATRPTAKIYVFPLRERVVARATMEQKLAAMEHDAMRVSADVFDGAWYHGMAVREADRSH